MNWLWLRCGGQNMPIHQSYIHHYHYHIFLLSLYQRINGNDMKSEIVMTRSCLVHLVTPWLCWYVCLSTYTRLSLNDNDDNDDDMMSKSTKSTNTNGDACV